MAVSSLTPPPAPADDTTVGAPTLTAPAAEPTRARLAALDGLRFAAAAAVVLYHFTARRTTSWGTHQAELGALGKWATYGSLGPELFFVISGFVILMTAWGRSTAKVVASRVARIYPAYWVAVLATGALLLLVYPAGKAVTPGEVLVNLTMVQQAAGYDHVDGVYWTLWTELRFYVLIGAFTLVGVTRRRVLGVVLLWPWVALWVERQGWDTAAMLLVSDYAPLFSVGMAIYVVHRWGHGVLPWLAVGLGTWLAVQRVVPSRTAVLNHATAFVTHRGAVAAALVVCVALVAAVTLTPLARVEWRGLVVLGALTYPLYLVHQYWGLYVIHEVVDAVPAYVALACALVAVTALAWLVHLLIERPAGPRMRRAVQTGLERARDAVLGPVSRAGRLLAWAPAPRDALR
ncbi:acyltransferase family protein [Cellulomonas alba]|uniref:Acyltransferase n=1 Tax=Cellulomonas alba TaxID=3053467 RepID=A0ABT7SDB2_9CELL|nr:acyltransferase [Cellulomonas alba]MDM7854044.1 acyltransferase [Cellulomonas alba]